MQKRALIVIDIQNDYFPGGAWELHDMDVAVKNAAAILEATRHEQGLVIHIRHEFLNENPPFFAPGSEGAEIHHNVKPLGDEVVITKNAVNSFQDTNLKNVLDSNGITDVTMIGAMSHMCIDAAARAASDFGFSVTVVEDACASRDLEFGDKVVNANDVHAAYMSALSFAYANVVKTTEYLASE
ncbi:cysteine hydrolase family protein [Pseudoteredinibacter isoporae]|uniref:Nicotinamidase-related amidase n=1 Tax=Pseudoteredinibacter isoporae TaxID=570281 RepID=A0A7X0MXZ4_9GAMM|nr:cysteine hydrolase family protein [Pseudoteredinibacter isoporae]MBB6522514.1 nicotinamidase-related amidase [Pseudoteredinibacter isoporae]NHO88043.1 cysteine hydrolase [Pseudoteredinibacter isoporae]NIB23626.1 cysteine hydrolase [Pseudoteredinibacter isoporae]